MASEPERRFLVQEGFDPAKLAITTTSYIQSYLPDTGAWVIRVRKTRETDGDRYYLTLKRPRSSITNTEFEPEITPEMYLDIVTETGADVVKTRHTIENAGHLWEVDVYEDPDVEPRMIAEVELSHETEPLAIPSWAGPEVTGDRWYSNAQIGARLTERAKTRGEAN